MGNPQNVSGELVDFSDLPMILQENINYFWCLLSIRSDVRIISGSPYFSSIILVTFIGFHRAFSLVSSVQKYALFCVLLSASLAIIGGELVESVGGAA